MLARFPCLSLEDITADWTRIIAYELNLEQGIQLERRVFHGLFGTKDQKEGL